jgi:hypothetical protein
MLSVSKRARLQLLSRQLRSFHTSRFISQDAKKDSHTADHYIKDVDTNPPYDPTFHRVDAGSESAQRPHEPPSSKWSQAGTQTSQYTNVDKDEPYNAPRNDKKAKTGYGAVKDSSERAGRTGSPDEGPQAKDAGGRK